LITKKRINVLLAEDHPILRVGFRALLEAEDNITAATPPARVASGPIVISRHLRYDGKILLNEK
jgi:DNA-binding NarL/FixJ family response regulator